MAQQAKGPMTARPVIRVAGICGLAEEGPRLPVDRLSPRGLSRSALSPGGWPKDPRPRGRLRRRFHADRGRWPNLRRPCFQECAVQPEAVSGCLGRRGKGLVTLLNAAQGMEIRATVLRDLLPDQFGKDRP